MSFQLRNESSGEVHLLEEKRISVGAADSSNIVIKNPGVPPTQCFLSKTKLGYFLMNFHPQTHITINDDDVKEKMLKPGDRIHIGDSTFVYEEAGAPADEPAETSPKETEAPAEEKPAVAAAESQEEVKEEVPAEAELPTEVRPTPDEETPEEEPSEESPAAGTAAEVKEEASPAPWEVAPEVPPGKAAEEEPVPLSPEEAERLFGPAGPGKQGPAAAAEVKEGGVYTVKVHGGSKDGETIEFTEKLSIGRSDENDLVLLSQTVSRRHAELHVEDGQLHVRDLGSASGVLVNGARVKEDTIGIGDHVEVGDIILQIGSAPAPEPEAAPVSEEPAVEEPRPPEKPREKGTIAGIKPLLLVMGGALDGKIVPVSGTMRVGSSPDSGLVLSDPEVMASHMELVEEEGALSIRPLAGPVKVNGADLEKEEALSKGDAIELAGILLLVRETKKKPPAEAPEGEEPGKAPAEEEPQELEVAAAGPEEKQGGDTPPMGIAPLAIGEGKAAAEEAGISEQEQQMPAEEAKFRLIVKGGKMDGKSFPVTGGMTIGRESGNLIVLLDAAVSRRHAKVAPEEGGVRITDLGSTGGIWVNGKKVQEALLTHGDLVRIGHTEIQVRDLSYDLLPETEKPPLPSSLNAVKLSRGELPSSDKHSVTMLKGDDEGCHFEIRGNVTMGRHKSCDVVIHHEEASGKHAEIVMDGPRPLVKDHGSTNGTRVNGTRIGARYVYHGDVIELANVELLFREPGRPMPAPETRRPSLIMKERGSEKTIRQKLGLYTLIGRDEQASIPLRDTESSTEHAAVFERDGAYYIRDLKSTNGTKVNGTRTLVETRLQHGDVITVGMSTLTFKEPDKPLPTPAHGMPVSTLVVVALAVLVVIGGGLVFLFHDVLFPPSGPGPGENGNGSQTPAANLLENGGFEQADAGWLLPPGTAEIVQDVQKSGEKCLRIGPAGDTDPADVVVKSKLREPVNSTYYKVAGAVRTSQSRGYCGIRLRWTDGVNPISQIPDSFTFLVTGDTNGWFDIQETFEAPPRPEGVGVMYLQLALVAAGATGDAWFDDVHLEAVVQPGFEVRSRPRLSSASDLYTVRAGDSGVFSVDYYGNNFLFDGHFELERTEGRGASQTLCSITSGPVQKIPNTYNLTGKMLDFASGEEADFEQNLLGNSGDEIAVTYMVRRLPTTTGYKPILVMTLPQTPESFHLFDKRTRVWDFQEAFSLKKDVVEVQWPVRGGAVVMAIQPPSSVETRPASKGSALNLRILPGFTTSGQISITFRKSSMSQEHEANLLLDEIRTHMETGRFGQVLNLCKKYLERFKELDERRREVQKIQVEVLGEAKTKIELWEQRWEAYEGRRNGLGPDERSDELDKFVQECGGQASAYDGSDFKDRFARIRDAAQTELDKLQDEAFAKDANKYLDPAEKDLEAGNVLSARIIIDTLKTRAGLLEKLPADLRTRFENLQNRLKEMAAEADPEALLKDVDILLEQGDKEKAFALCRRIIGLFPYDPENPDRYSEYALEAFRKLRG